jgi:apolipoprotein N-acyltransferase
VTVVQVAASVGVAVLSGWWYRRTVDLRPWVGAAWLAPLPLLALAPRVSWWLAVGAAVVAWLRGQLGLWSYYAADLRVPVAVQVARIAASGLGVAAIVALTRAQMVAGRPVLAALTPAVAWAALEFLVAVCSRHGAWWSLAYSQADHPTVLQVASLTGVPGVTAVLLLPSGVFAAVAAPGGSVRTLVLMLLVAVAAGAVLTGWSRARMRPGASAEAVHVGLVAQPATLIRLDSPQGAALAEAYMQQVRLLAGRGAVIIVLPELAFAVDADRLSEQVRPFGQLAAEAGITLVVGFEVDGPQETANRAAVFVPDGAAPRWYQKHHLVPGLEDVYQPGHDLLLVPVGTHRSGLMICKDLDFPKLVRRYRRAGAGLLLAPAWDRQRDGWLHSRMAVVRGVESGAAIARVARSGRATVSDGFGRIVVDAATDGPVALDAVVQVAAASGYSRFGDWFGWACAVATAFLVLTAV